MELLEDRTKILIVDEDVNVVETIRTCFPVSRYECITATKSGVALELLKQMRFSVAVCSVDLSDIDGIELLRRSRAKYPHTAFIMLIETGNSRQAMEAGKLGAHACVPKPFTSAPSIFIRLSVR